MTLRCGQTCNLEQPASERVLDLRRAQSSYFIAVVLCKIACLIACSTRRLSLFQFGLTYVLSAVDEIHV